MYRYLLVISTGIFLLSSSFIVASQKNQRQEVLWNNDCPRMLYETQKDFLPGKILGRVKHPIKLFPSEFQGLQVSKIENISKVIINNDPNSMLEKEIDMTAQAISAILKNNLLPDLALLKDNLVILSTGNFDTSRKTTDYLAVKFKSGEYIIKFLKSTGYNLRSHSTFAYMAVEHSGGQKFESLNLARSILKKGILPLRESYPKNREVPKLSEFKNFTNQGDFNAYIWLTMENFVQKKSGKFYNISNSSPSCYGKIGSCYIFDVFYMTNNRVAFFQMTPTPIPRFYKQIRADDKEIYSLKSSQTNK